MKKALMVVLATAVISVVASLAAPQIEAAPMELKAVACFPRDNITNAQIPAWIDRMNKELSGTLKINWIGGPEVIAPFDQAEALRKGMFQIAFIASAYYMGMLPDADAVSLSKYDFKKEREKGGFWDYFIERHKLINIIPVGTCYYDPYYLWVRKPVKNVADMQGFKMRTAAKHDRMMVRLGMVPVSLQMPDTYTALQRGVVDGFVWPTLGPRDWGWTENVKNVIDVPFHGRMNYLILMNLDTWKKLPKEAQDKVIEITTAYEPEMRAYYQKAIENEKQQCTKIGVKRVKFGPDDARKILDAADEAGWEAIKKAPPNVITEYKKLLGYK